MLVAAQKGHESDHLLKSLDLKLDLPLVACQLPFVPEQFTDGGQSARKLVNDHLDGRTRVCVSRAAPRILSSLRT